MMKSSCRRLPAAWATRASSALLTATALAFACGTSSLGGDGSQDAGPEAGLDAAPQADASPPAADAGVVGALLGSYQMTYYWVAFEGDFSGPATTALYDEQCGTLATVSSAFASALRIEGSGKLLDGRVLNYAGSCSCPSSPCYSNVGDVAPWGRGVQNIALRPFRSIAVDTSRISIGTGIYIAELDGLLMPGGSDIGMYVHDGCVIADDVGGAIRGKHIDFFAGLRDHYLTISAAIGSDRVQLREGGERCAGR